MPSNVKTPSLASHQTISINEALHALRSGDPCHLVIVRSTRNAGSLKSIEECCHGFAYKHFLPKQKEEYMQRNPSGDYSKHALQGTLPIIDLSTGNQLTILISHIIYCNHKKVIH